MDILEFAKKRKPAVPKSAFLELPPEIRQHIYSYILPYTIKDRKLSLPNTFYAVLWIRASTTLLRVCHSVHDECADLIYNTNTFVIDIAFSAIKFHMTWLTTKNLRPKILYNFPDIFADKNIRRIKNYAVQIEHVDSYQGMIKYNCSGPMLTAGIRERVQSFAHAAHQASKLGCLYVCLMDGNPVLKDIRCVTAYRVEKGKDVVKMQEVLQPLQVLYASFVNISGAVTAEYAAQLKQKILLSPELKTYPPQSSTVQPAIEPAVLWRWQMNWNA